MARSPFAKTAPLTPRQRSKGLVLPLSEKEAQVLRAMLGRTSDKETRGLLANTRTHNYAGALFAMDMGTSTAPIFLRIHRACERRGLAR